MRRIQMSWTGIYRLALRVLPAELRRKHGAAIEALFAYELQRARRRGRLSGISTGAAGVWDVVRRGAYEHVATAHRALAGHCDHQPRDKWNPHTRGQDIACANLGDRSMPPYSTRQLLRHHAFAFTIAFVAFTAALLALFASKRLPELSAQGASTATLIEALLLAVPFTAAMTIPMAVFVAVLFDFTRLGAEGALISARGERGGIRRLVIPMLWAATGVAALTLVLNTQILPRANKRLVEVLAPDASGRADRTVGPSSRTMMIGELRAAARNARRDAGPDARAIAASYEVEVHKKYALAAACVILALVAASIGLYFHRGGTPLVIGASCAVFFAYYFCITTGETLADELVVSPFVAMWAANALFLAAALLGVWPGRRPLSPSPDRLAVITE